MSAINERNQKIIDEFRANQGKVGGNYTDRTLLLLHTKGAKSQQERINPLAYISDGDRLVVIAAKAGAPTHPDWYYNALADPLVTVEVGTEKFQARAAVTNEPERTRLFNQMVEIAPWYDEYQQKTTRVIPVVILTPVN